MRLLKLYIKGYRALRELTIDFTTRPSTDEQHYEALQRARQYTLHLLVGVNGTGKSTLLRLLVKLFQRFNENTGNLGFGFEVSYQLEEGGEVISITNIPECAGVEVEDLNETGLFMHRSSQKQGYERLTTSIDSRNLPERIIAFTTGSEREWLADLTVEESPDDPEDKSVPSPDPNSDDFHRQLQEWYLHELPDEPLDGSNETLANQERVVSNFHFIRTYQLPLITFCGMLVDMYDASQSPEHEAKKQPSEPSVQSENETNVQPSEPSVWMHLKRVMDGAGILALRGFSLRFRMNEDNIRPDRARTISQLRRYAHHTVQVGADYLLVFDLISTDSDASSLQHKKVNKTLLENLLFLEGSAFNLFSMLARLQESDVGEDALLQDVNLFLERPYSSEEKQHTASEQEQQERQPLHLFKWLSDGEQSFLGRLCLMPLLRDSNALILLDEPEVHFNDYWKRKLILMLDNAMHREPVTTNKDTSASQSQQAIQSSHVVMTTHSSITLTDVLNTDIIILKRRNGYTSSPEGVNLRTLGADPSDVITAIFDAEQATGARGNEFIESELERIRDHVPNTQKVKELEKLLKVIGPSHWRYHILREIHRLEALGTREMGGTAI